MYLVDETPPLNSHALLLLVVGGGRGGIGMFPTKADKGTEVRAWVSAFQNTKRAENFPKPDLGVIVLRRRVSVRVFGRRCLNETRA